MRIKYLGFKTATLLLLLLLSQSTLSKDYTASEVVGISNDCLDCHDDMSKSLSGSTHELSGQRPDGRIVVGCINCHSGWKTHIEDPSADNISNPGMKPASEQNEICATCHETPHQMAMQSFDPHGLAGMKCTDCHQIHNNKNERLLAKSSHQFCLSCHSEVASEFKRRSVHPYDTGVIECVGCHTMGEMAWSDGSVERNWTCQNCHADYAGPFIYEHPVTSKFPTEGSGCGECHQPHGSSNERLLNQPGSGLCQQCHGVPKHKTAHNGSFANVACIDCHSQIHGSYDSKNFLDPMIGSNFGDGPDGCYCHTGGN